MNVAGCQPYAPATFTARINLVLIFRGRFDPRAHGIVRFHGKESPSTPGIDPGTFRLVAQWLSHYATPSPQTMSNPDILRTISEGIYLHSLEFWMNIRTSGSVSEKNFYQLTSFQGYAVVQLVKALCFNRKVAGSIPDGITGIFHLHNPSCRTMALGLTQHLTEMSSRIISCGVKAAGD